MSRAFVWILNIWQYYTTMKTPKESSLRLRQGYEILCDVSKYKKGLHSEKSYWLYIKWLYSNHILKLLIETMKAVKRKMISWTCEKICLPPLCSGFDQPLKEMTTKEHQSRFAKSTVYRVVNLFKECSRIQGKATEEVRDKTVILVAV